MLKPAQQQSADLPAAEPDTRVDGRQAVKPRTARKPFKTAKVLRAPKTKPQAPVSKVLQVIARQPANREIERAARSLALALENGAELEVVDRLARALQVRADEPEAVEVVDELTALLRDQHDPMILGCLAGDLERGADPDLIGALADYVKAGLSPEKIGALAWLFPRRQWLRPHPAAQNAIA